MNVGYGKQQADSGTVQSYQDGLQPRYLETKIKALTKGKTIALIPCMWVIWYAMLQLVPQYCECN